MKRLSGDILYWFLTLSLGYMIYTGDYTYLNIVDVVYSLLLLVTTVLVTLTFLLLKLGLPNLEESFNEYKVQLSSRGLISKIWGYLKNVLTIVVLTMSGHTFLLGWYIVCTLICIGFDNWLSNKETYL